MNSDGTVIFAFFFGIGLMVFLIFSAVIPIAYDAGQNAMLQGRAYTQYFVGHDGNTYYQRTKEYQIECKAVEEKK